MNVSASARYIDERANVDHPFSAQIISIKDRYGINNAQNTSPELFYIAEITDGKKTMSDHDRYIDAKIEAVEARGDAKIARIDAKIDLIIQTVQTARVDAKADAAQAITEGRENRRAIIANAWVILGVIVVFIGIIVALAPFSFDMGSRFRESVSKEIQDHMSDGAPKK